jgi:hypothetical protein
MKEATQDEFAAAAEPSRPNYLSIQKRGPERSRSPIREHPNPYALAALMRIAHRVALGQATTDELREWESQSPERQATVIRWCHSDHDRKVREAAHERRRNAEVRVFGDRARAFYGMPLVGSHRTRRPRSALRSGRPSCSRRVRRSSSSSSGDDSSGESGPGEPALAAFLPAGLAPGLHSSLSRIGGAL